MRHRPGDHGGGGRLSFGKLTAVEVEAMDPAGPLPDASPAVEHRGRRHTKRTEIDQMVGARLEERRAAPDQPEGASGMSRFHGRA